MHAVMKDSWMISKGFTHGSWKEPCMFHEGFMHDEGFMDDL
jgi:hypothetical protein